MEQADRNILLRQILWDYNISVNDIEKVLQSKKKYAGHYNREKIFLKIIESYSWFTILQLFSPYEIKELLTENLTGKLRSQSLRQKYEFVRKRLYQTLPSAG